MTRLSLVEAVEEVLAGAARMEVDLRSTLDISDAAFDALTAHGAQEPGSTAAPKALAALGVLIHDSAIRAFLNEHDPQALRQAIDAWDALREEVPNNPGS